jgi:hypothetical protein
LICICFKSRGLIYFYESKQPTPLITFSSIWLLVINWRNFLWEWELKWTALCEIPHHHFVLIIYTRKHLAWSKAMLTVGSWGRNQTQRLSKEYHILMTSSWFIRLNQ